jgi:cytochrome c-type biogenesis protein CcmE
MTVRVKLSIALVLVVFAIGFLMVKAVKHASSDYMTVNGILRGTYGPNQTFTVSGNIVGGTVSFDASNRVLRFSIEDPQGDKSLPVVFHGAKPDDFSNGWPVIVTGRLSSPDTFNATQILIKCPSKYSAKGSETWKAEA